MALTVFSELGAQLSKWVSPISLEHIRLQVSHESVEFRHTVRDGGAGGECNALSFGQFIHITAFCKHVGGLLCVCSGHARHGSHLGINVEIFEILRLVYQRGGPRPVPQR